MDTTRQILIIAGETSGDTHGAGIVTGLLECDPELRITGIGGSEMESRGMELLYHVRDVSFMGFAEIIRHLPFLKRMRDDLLDWMDANDPDAVILIDYPGFNLRFAKKIQSRDVPVYYYISPQVWAWGKRRLKTMGDYLRRMYVIFPFEEELYREHGIPSEFVGHPLVEEIEHISSRDAFLSDAGLDPSRRVLGMFPGSRRQELQRHMDVMLDAWERLRAEADRDLQACVAVAPDLEADLPEMVRSHPEVRLVQGRTHGVMQHCDVAVASSGTATLELAYFRTPMVIIYRMNFLTYWIGRLLVDMPYIGLANIVAGEQVVPELIQGDVTPGRIAGEVSRYLRDTEYYQGVRESLGSIRAQLGEPGASRRVAESIYRELYGG